MVEINAADVVIDEEDIKVTFKEDVLPADALAAAQGLITKLKGLTEAGTLTLYPGLDNEKVFNLNEDNVAVKVAGYILGQGATRLRQNF